MGRRKNRVREMTYKGRAVFFMSEYNLKDIIRENFIARYERYVKTKAFNCSVKSIQCNISKEHKVRSTLKSNNKNSSE